ncbi:MAG: hypothetical protein A4E35_00778 [Methanoregula sp. PtaU1.Bin051]|nr:MAG: hypothetical protein A4E35_00778 [Methanoregula sp. PtaU1.Bin051]
MTPKDGSSTDRPAAGNSRKRKTRLGKRAKPKTSRRKTWPHAPVAGPLCRIIAGEGSCPEWEDILLQYPMIDSVQREDFPEHGASFVHLAHFYRTDDTAKESFSAQEQFEAFFREVGYEYDYSGNFKSRWFEGIGVHIG